MTWAQLHAEAAARLGSAPEARWLVEEVTGERWPSAALTTSGPGAASSLANTSSSAALGMSERARTRFEGLVARRAAGEPLQYVLGRWPFRTLDLMVDRRVLIPRPETEQVVEAALGELERMDTASSARPRSRIAVDLGTGSGAIALSLAAERPRLEVWATDVSPDALNVAAANLAGLGGRAAARVRLTSGAWWAALPDELQGRVDLVVSNPPYVSSAEMSELDPQIVLWEPRLSLEAGPTGLEALQEVLRGAQSWLRPGGAIVVEIAPHQAAAATQLAEASGFSEIEVHRDLAGRDRAVVARMGP
jgi:release factor glutamine methyltransferase